MDVAKAFDDKAPSGQELTAYDRTHIKLYMRLLDATTEEPTGRKWWSFCSGLIRRRSLPAPARCMTAIWSAPAGSPRQAIAICSHIA